ncbi:MAG: hypothetical protein MUE46_15465 [Xanthomonadales bacterium]|jgi:ABC-type molybdate transport system permease subunit|nr:hypothetical protein [Xanthomonadales bacterium]
MQALCIRALRVALPILFGLIVLASVGRSWVLGGSFSDLIGLVKLLFGLFMGLVLATVLTGVPYLLLSIEGHLRRLAESSVSKP